MENITFLQGVWLTLKKALELSSAHTKQWALVNNAISTNISILQVNNIYNFFS